MTKPFIEPDVMRISWGPQHPMSGQTRILLDVDWEKVHKIIADLGFTHRGIEKILENRSFHQGIIPIERMVMIDTPNIGLGYITAIEKSLGVEVPERANWIRSLICEMARISSHLYAFGLQAESTGYFPAVFIWTTADRQVLHNLFEQLTGARFSFNFFLPGGVYKDLPEGFEDKVIEGAQYLRRRFEDYWEAMVENAVFEARCNSVAVLKPEDAIRSGATGPVLRGSGVAMDVRKDEPEKTIAIVVFKEAGKWVMAPAPKALRDGLDALYEAQDAEDEEEAPGDDDGASPGDAGASKNDAGGGPS